MGPEFDVQREEREDASLVRVSGEVDLATEALLRSALDAEARASREVILDCSRLSYIDSTGLRLLAEFQTRGLRLILAAPSPTVRKLLGIAGLDALFPVVSSVEAALNALRRDLGPSPITRLSRAPNREGERAPSAAPPAQSPG